ncbi:c-type cytochrome [Sphingobacterium hungaricum]|uniref:Cytochrome C n=1 Tax=Sphingobacterium hungaricum TaxID=2082723 RepID=A0A928V1X5_9SPHI|nr:cytochrome c [Sphingobacterium hungaricum]MBE8714634.1 cytochrome C [Sphingobacterium hungaricum]
MPSFKLSTSLFAILGLVIAFSNCQSKESVEKAQYVANGRKLFATHCQNCHGADGKGLGKLYPPLDDTLFYKEHQDKLACYIKYGIDTTIHVHGIAYNSKMPENPTLTPIDIAYLITYITTEFGNSETKVSVDDVNKQLENCQ